MFLVRRVLIVCLALAWGCDDKCRSQCELAAGGCEEKPLASFGDLESARVELQGRCADDARWAFEATCKEGTIVLRSGTGYTSEGRFYDPGSGAFKGLTTTTDVQDETCEGKSYWPETVPCSAPTVTRVICGDAFKVGDSGGPGITQS
jgi:hypothetical protein